MNNRGKLFGFLLIISCIFIIGNKFTKAKSETEAKRKITTTQLIVKNTDTVNVDMYITIGAPGRQWVSSVKGIFGIKTKGLQGKITLLPQQTVRYITPLGKAIQGNICFNSAPSQCPGGTTIVEFCLNNATTGVTDPQETIEISCVSGITYIASIDMSGGKGIWTANYTGFDTLTHIQNDVFGKNSGLPGVYPYGCDNCTSQSSQAPSCTIGKNEPPQINAICNVQRDADKNGGSIKISYIKKL